LIPIAILTLNTALVLVLVALTFVFYALMSRVERSPGGKRDLPFISIVVPARNEEGKIERCLESLAGQDYPCFEIVVVDDRSTDRTAEIIERAASRDPRIKFITAKSLPEGWIGKCNALVHAGAHASGEWLLFTDADTCHRSNSARDAVSYAMRNQADLVSFVPVQELGGFWERAVMPVLLGSFLLGDPFHTVNNQRQERAYAYGQYVLARRSAYEAAGGHQAVRDEILEDHAIARVVKRKGFVVLCADGHDLYSVRMYTSLKTMWQGWTKNLYSLIDCRPLNLILILTLINCALLAPFLHLLAAASTCVQAPPGDDAPVMAALALVEMAALFAWYRRTCYHYQGVDWRHFLLLPLGALTVTVLYLHAAYLVHSGGQVNWKGRRYTVNSSRTIERTGGAHLDPALDRDTSAYN